MSSKSSIKHKATKTSVVLLSGFISLSLVCLECEKRPNVIKYYSYMKHAEYNDSNFYISDMSCVRLITESLYHAAPKQTC